MILYEFGIAKNSEYMSKAKPSAANSYDSISGNDWGKYISSPSEFIKESWDKIEFLKKGIPNNIRGGIFEYLVSVCLYTKKIYPFYTQATLALVPNAIYDIALYTSHKQLITLSLKVSLRERYKQSDLEGLVLKNVHRRAKNYLITLNDAESKNVSKKIKK